MAYGAWMPHAMSMTVLANIHRDKKKQRRPYTMEDFHPLATRGGRRGGMPLTEKTVEMIARGLPER